MKKKCLLGMVLAIFIYTPLWAQGEVTVPANTQQSREFDTLGQSNIEKGTTDEPEAYVPASVFGTKGGYIHPFMSVTLKSSSNINYSYEHTKSDWTAIYTPGVWLATPARREIYLNLDTYNTSPGGRYHQIDNTEAFTRYQAYALYVADIEDFFRYSERDTVKQSAEVYFQYNLRGGLSASAYDKYSDTEDPMSYSYISNAIMVDRYTSNLLGIILEYDLGERFRIRADYNNFYLDYDKAVSKGKNRTDNSYAVYLYYYYSPKTALFGEYEYIDANYDVNKIQNSTQNYGYVGINWKPTEKVTLKAKAGLVSRNSDNPEASSVTGPVLEFTYEHKLTEKTKMKLFLARKLNESTISTSAYSKDTIANFWLNKIITDKIETRLLLDYIRNDFEGNIGSSRIDKLYTISPRVRYVFKDWLQAEAGYEYAKRTSDVKIVQFDSSTFFIRFSAGF